MMESVKNKIRVFMVNNLRPPGVVVLSENDMLIFRTQYSERYPVLIKNKHILIYTLNGTRVISSKDVEDGKPLIA